MPTAVLSKARDYTNPSLFKGKKFVKGERVKVTDEEADHLASTGHFEIIEDNAAPKRGGIKVTAKPVKAEASVAV